MRFKHQLYLLFFLFVINAFQGKAQVITGTITNEQNETIPYATIFVKEKKEGTITSSEGNFILLLEKGTYHLIIRSLGYFEVEKEVQLNNDSLNVDLVLKKQEFEIKEVKVFPGKEDPAYFIIRKAMAKAHYYREKIKHYEADLYIKSNFKFTNVPKLLTGIIPKEDKEAKYLLKEGVVHVIESQNKIIYDYPGKYDQKVISKKSTLVGIDEEPVMGLMTSNFYEERPNAVISPLASMALKRYKYRYEGFITVGDYDVYKIKVSPKRKSDELVEGYLYIVDQLWCIYYVDFNSRIEFFKYRIKQQYENLGNGNWLPVSHNINGTFGILGLKGNFNYGASVKYNAVEENNFENAANKTVDKNTGTQAIKEKGQKEIALRKQVTLIAAKEELTNKEVKKVARLNRKILKEQYKDSTLLTPKLNNYNINDKKDSLITLIAWDTLRAIPLTPTEIKSYQRADSLVSLQKMELDTLSSDSIKKGESQFSKVFFGSNRLYKDSIIRLEYDGIFSPANFDFNAVDGYKYKQRFQLRINPDSAKYIFITPELGYAFNRKAVFGSFSSRFINILGYGNLLSLSAGKISSDFKHPSIGISPMLNAISSWFFAKNYMKLYEKEFLRLNLSQRFKKNFFIGTEIKFDNFHPLENNISYTLSDKKDYSSNIPVNKFENSPELQQQKSFEYTLSTQYRKRQQKPWLEESPFLFMDDFYFIQLYYRQGVKGVFSSVSDFKQIDFRFHQQANISPSAGIDWHVNAGYFFNTKQMHFSQFKHFKTAEIPVSFNSFTHTFQLQNDYEFSTNKSYINIGGEFRTEYILLRYLSFLNQRTWSESLHFNYLTTSALKNCWEVGYSLNSLFFVGNLGVFVGFKGNKFESVAVKISISPFD